ncbi:MAG: hypothetical protein ACI828_001155 [Flavobacteriales bacterium]
MRLPQEHYGFPQKRSQCIRELFFAKSNFTVGKSIYNSNKPNWLTNSLLGEKITLENQYTNKSISTQSGNITLYDMQRKEVKRLFEGDLSQAQKRTFLRADLASGI